MVRTMIAPSKFVLGEDVLDQLGEYLADFGRSIVIVAHSDDYARVEDQLAHGLAHMDSQHLPFGGESSDNEIDKAVRQIKKQEADVVVGLGGGKALDTAKAAATLTKRPVVIIPTIASTDAPTSALSIIYTDEGEFVRYMHLPKNPDLVLVDSGVIARAPVRFLVAGMGDALATVFEARACAKAFSNNMSGGQSTRAAQAIAEVCYKVLMEDSAKAKAACESGVVTPALENIIEANILLSGLGFESSGLAAAHAIHDGLTMLEETHSVYHGEKVAFGTLVQLVLENADSAQINEVLDYCMALGLPTCFADLGIEDKSQSRMEQVAEKACAEDETMKNMPFPVQPKDVVAALYTADVLGGGTE